MKSFLIAALCLIAVAVAIDAQEQQDDTELVREKRALSENLGSTLPAAGNEAADVLSMFDEAYTNLFGAYALTGWLEPKAQFGLQGSNAQLGLLGLNGQDVPKMLCKDRIHKMVCKGPVLKVISKDLVRKVTFKGLVRKVVGKDLVGKVVFKGLVHKTVG
uniref:Secreted protein n=1 Tax=Plectus sambesii TaxID=2011161 RepID=A0A914V937_9BILA